MPWTAPTDSELGAAQTPGTGTAPVRADLTYTILQRLRDGIAGVYTSAVQAIAGLTPSADTFAYFTATGAALANITAFARGFLGSAADQASAQSYLGIGGGASAPAAHEATHLSGGTDPLAGDLDATARTGIWHNGTPVAARRALDLVEGSNVTLGFVDDGPNEVVHVTVAAPAIGSTSLSDNAVLPRHMLGKTGNLFPDPKLETAFASVWTIVGPWSRVQISTHPDCDWAAQIAGGSASDAYLRVFPSEVMPVRPGETLYLSFDTRLGASGSTATSQMQIGMSFVGLLGASLGELTVGAVPPTSPYTTVSGTITVPAGAKLANIFLKRPANTDTYAYRATELRCRRRLPPEELVAGTAGLALLAAATVPTQQGALGLPTPATGNALQALRVNAAGTAYEATAFPSVIPAFYPGPTAANWYRSGHWTGNGTTLLIAANTVYMVLFKLEVLRRAWTLAALDVTTAAAGNGDVTLWNLDPATGKVGTTKVFQASITTGSTGIRSGSISPVLEPGWYVSRITLDNAATVRGHATALSHPWGMDATGNAPLLCKTIALGSYTPNPTTPEDIATGFVDNSTAAPTLYLQ